MKLSPHFTLEEFTRSVSYPNITNVPNDEQIANMILLCAKILEPLRTYFNAPISITSGYRGPELNKAIGGKDDSQHSRGQAADIKIKGVANAEVFKYIRDNLKYDQVIAEKLSRKDGHAGWIHVSFSKASQRQEAISYLGSGKYVVGLKFID